MLVCSEEYAAEIIKGKGRKILTPNQMLSRLPISLAQLNAENSSEKLKNEFVCSSSYFAKKKKKDIELLQQLKLGFKRNMKWNKHRSQMTVQPNNSNLNYLIDPTFTNNNRLFVLSFPRSNNIDSRYPY